MPDLIFLKLPSIGFHIKCVQVIKKKRFDQIQRDKTECIIHIGFWLELGNGWTWVSWKINQDSMSLHNTSY